MSRPAANTVDVQLHACPRCGCEDFFRPPEMPDRELCRDCHWDRPVPDSEVPAAAPQHLPLMDAALPQAD